MDNEGNKTKAIIKDIHFDDSETYYSIIIDGNKNERQTIKNKLIKINNNSIINNNLNETNNLVSNNETVIKILKEISDIYKLLGDEFRHKAYRKAYLSIKKFKGDIEKNKVNGVGKKYIRKNIRN